MFRQPSGMWNRSTYRWQIARCTSEIAMEVCDLNVDLATLGILSAANAC